MVFVGKVVARNPSQRDSSPLRRYRLIRLQKVRRLVRPDNQPVDAREQRSGQRNRDIAEPRRIGPRLLVQRQGGERRQRESALRCGQRRRGRRVFHDGPRMLQPIGGAHGGEKDASTTFRATGSDRVRRMETRATAADIAAQYCVRRCAGTPGTPGPPSPVPAARPSPHPSPPARNGGADPAPKPACRTPCSSPGPTPPGPEESTARPCGRPFPPASAHRAPQRRCRREWRPDRWVAENCTAARARDAEAIELIQQVDFRAPGGLRRAVRQRQVDPDSRLLRCVRHGQPVRRKRAEQRGGGGTGERQENQRPETAHITIDHSAPVPRGSPGILSRRRESATVKDTYEQPAVHTSSGGEERAGRAHRTGAQPSLHLESWCR